MKRPVDSRPLWMRLATPSLRGSAIGFAVLFFLWLTAVVKHAPDAPTAVLQALVSTLTGLAFYFFAAWIVRRNPAYRPAPRS